MKNVIILGANGNIASRVIDILVEEDDIHLTLFLRNKRKLRNTDLSNAGIIEGDVLNYQQLKHAIRWRRRSPGARGLPMVSWN